MKQASLIARLLADASAIACEVSADLGPEADVEAVALVVRRSARARFDSEGGVDSLAPAAAVMAELLGWSADESDRQVKACLAIREHEMSAVRKTANRAQQA